MKTWRLTIVIETEADNEEEAVWNIQHELYDYSMLHPSKCGDWEEIDEDRTGSEG